MNNDHPCNHAEAIAKELHHEYKTAIRCDSLSDQSPAEWEQLTETERHAWRCVADKALPVICNHALEDMQDYFEISASTVNGWKKVLYWAGGIILAGIIGGSAATLTGCGAAASISLSSSQGMLSISRSSNGVLVISTAPPVAQASKK